MSSKRSFFYAIILVAATLLLVSWKQETVGIWVSVPDSLNFGDLTISILNGLNKSALMDESLNMTGIYESEAASRLPRSGSIFCFVLSVDKYYRNRVPAVNQTWLKRCDHGQFFVKKTMNDESIPYTTVFHDLDDTWGQLFYKTIRAFYYAYVEVSAEFDWYLKSDDDNYIIMEHLREFLSGYDPKKPLYLGYEWVYAGNYHSGGAGYVLSRAAVKKFVEEAYGNRTICPFYNYEDVAIGTCLRSIGITPTTTEEALARFMPLHNDSLIIPEVISLHYQSPEDMRHIETFLYKVDNPKLSKFYVN